MKANNTTSHDPLAGVACALIAHPERLTDFTGADVSSIGAAPFGAMSSAGMGV